MKFYQENKVNPFGSCLPLVLQLPVFFSLFYMLRKDLKIDICGPEAKILAAAKEAGKTLTTIGCDQVDPGSAKFLFINDLTAKATGGDAGDPARPLRRLAAALERADVGHGRPQPALHHDRAAVRVRAVHPGLPGRPARLLDHHEPVDRRPAVHHPARGRVAGARRAGSGPATAAVSEQDRERADEGQGPGQGQGGQEQAKPSAKAATATATAPRPSASSTSAGRAPRPRRRQRRKKKTGRRR